MNKTAQTIDTDYQKIKEYLVDSFFNRICLDKPLKQQDLNKFHKCAIALKAFDLVSIIMSYLALNNYKQGARYYLTQSLLNDAKYLAISSNSLLAQKINLFCASLIEYYDGQIPCIYSAAQPRGLRNETR